MPTIGSAYTTTKYSTYNSTYIKTHKSTEWSTNKATHCIPFFSTIDKPINTAIFTPK